MQSQDFSPIIKTTEPEWIDAQKYEQHTWVINNKRNSFPKLVLKFLRALKKPKYFFQLLQFKDFYCGDDWNFWWMEKFNHYKDLPSHFNKALEVGSGPYSNIRLISKLKNIKEIVCTDPLMDIYKDFKMTWVSSMAKKSKIKALSGMCEKIDFPDGDFDLVVCNNVLDHVLDAEKGLLEMHRVLQTGGYFVFAQDLTDKKGIEDEEKREGHPIRLDHNFLDNLLGDKYEPVFKKILSREESRVPEYYGTYLLIGKKK
ncbi:MAG: class I SAM-dependent methyltransferase [bacterium]